MIKSPNQRYLSELCLQHDVPLESLNREKVIINCDESNAKGLKLVPLGRSSLINT